MTSEPEPEPDPEPGCCRAPHGFSFSFICQPRWVYPSPLREEDSIYGFSFSFICTSLDQWFANARTHVDRYRS